MTEMAYTETLVVTHCWCGIALAIPANLRRVAEDEGKSIYCPLGHTFIYGDSFADKLERERRSHRATRDLLRAEEHSHRTTRGHLTRVKRRVAHGVCPHCKRTFPNLAAHMQTKHPRVVDEQ